MAKKTIKPVKKGKCPYCDADLKEDGIAAVEKGEMIYEIYEQNGELCYQQDEFDSKGGGFFCRSCGEDLKLIDKQVIEILK